MLARNEWITPPQDDPEPQPESPPTPLYRDIDAIGGGILMVLSIVIPLWLGLR